MSSNSRATDLQTLSRTELQEILRVIRFKGAIAAKNKTELIASIMEADDKGLMKNYEAQSAIKKMREVLNLSTHRNIKSATQGLRKNKRDEAKDPKQLASEALDLVKKALSQKGKPKLKKQLVARMKKELEDFDAELKSITTDKKTQAKIERVRARERAKASAELKQDL